jgi:hypothetical protein
MSKEAAMRAMREARYLERTAGSASASTPARRMVRPVQSTPTEVDAVAPAAAAEALCGHRSMNGRTCTREQGHAAKNHRYS